MDALTAVLAVAGVRGTVAATLDAAEPWGLALDAVPGAWPSTPSPTASPGPASPAAPIPG